MRKKRTLARAARTARVGNSPRCNRVYHTADLCFILLLRASRTSLALSDISNSQANDGVGVLLGLHASNYKLKAVVGGWLWSALTAGAA